MAYSSLSDLLLMIPAEELAELTTDTGEVPDSQVVAEAIAQADAEIDAYAGRRYPVPLSPAPVQVKNLSVDLALYRLYSRRCLAPAVRQQRYEAAISFLKEVAGGQAVLEGVSPTSNGDAAEVADLGSAARVFSRGTMSDW